MKKAPRAQTREAFIDRTRFRVYAPSLSALLATPLICTS